MKKLDAQVHDPAGNSDKANEPVQQPARPGDKLPTLQRNALRKLFDRVDFSPEDVAALGYSRLQRIEGIGEKGLAIILAWLQRHEHVVAPVPRGVHRREKNSHRRLQQAVSIVEAHGFEVIPRRQED